MKKEKIDYLLQWIEDKMNVYDFHKQQELISSNTAYTIAVFEYTNNDTVISFYMKFGECVNLFISTEYIDNTPLGYDYKKITSTFIFEAVVKKFLKDKLGLE